jgi:uncharacterized Zn finger protein
MARQKLNPDLHMICGKCGNKNELSYSIVKEIDDETGEDKQEVSIFCDNCGTLTYLSEIIEEK